MKKVILLLIIAFCFCETFADEPLWTEKQRQEKRDIVIDGEVLKVKKSHELKNYKWSEVWITQIKVSEVFKGDSQLKGKTISVLYEQGTIIEGTNIRNARCPSYADLSKGDTGKFYIIKCNIDYLEKLEINENTKDALYIAMGSDCIIASKSTQNNSGLFSKISNILRAIF